MPELPRATAVASLAPSAELITPAPEVPTRSLSSSASAAPSAATRPTIPEAELFKPREGETLCTVLRRKDNRKSKLSTLRQFEDSRGFIVRTLETHDEGTEQSDSAMTTIRYSESGNALRAEVDHQPDGVADYWTRYEYDKEGRLTALVEEESATEKGFRVPVTVKGKLTGPGQTTGMLDPPQRYREADPVAAPPTKLPFEGEISRSVHDSHWFYYFDKRGLLVRRQVFLHGQLERGDKPYSDDRFQYDAAGRVVGKGFRYQAGKLVRSGTDEHLEERYEYDKIGRLSAVKQVEIKGGAVVFEEKIQRFCP